MANLSCGIIGLPNVGKSTLFNALLSRQVADCSNYPFCTIEPNVGVVEVPDERLVQLSRLTGIQKIVPAVVRFVDIAGLVGGAYKGEGLGNKFLAHIREVDLLLHVLRAFEDKNVANAGSMNPLVDFETVKTELILADLETLGKQKIVKGAIDEKTLLRSETIQKLKASFNEGKEAWRLSLTKEEQEEIKSLHLLTAKPTIAVLNISEQDTSRIPQLLQEYQDKYPKLFESTLDVVPLSAKIEFEIRTLPQEEQKEYFASLGLQASGIDFLIQKVFYALGLITFFTTTGEKEIRAWMIKKDTSAKEAGGVIHSDFEQKFVRAAVIPFDEFIVHGGWGRARELGKVRLEGKEYKIQDGDVVEFMIS